MADFSYKPTHGRVFMSPVSRRAVLDKRDFSAKIGTVPTDAEKIEIIKECAHRMIESYHRQLGMGGCGPWHAIWGLCVMKPKSSPADDEPIPYVAICHDMFAETHVQAREATRAHTRKLWEQYGDQLDISELVQAREADRQAYNARLQAKRALSERQIDE